MKSIKLIYAWVVHFEDCPISLKSTRKYFLGALSLLSSLFPLGGHAAIYTSAFRAVSYLFASFSSNISSSFSDTSTLGCETKEQQMVLPMKMLLMVTTILIKKHLHSGLYNTSGKDGTLTLLNLVNKGNTRNVANPIRCMIFDEACLTKHNKGHMVNSRTSIRIINYVQTLWKPTLFHNQAVAFEKLKPISRRDENKISSKSLGKRH
uniref:Uncharacterized protein n=1 Tax=Glossina palpalis gambiensis TaxID=67801 RepID=A0A1B0B9U5_9MUSC